MPKLPDYSACVDPMVEKSNGLLSKSEAKKILKEAADHMKERKAKGLIQDFDKEVQAFIDGKAKEIKASNLQENIEKIVNHEAKAKFGAYMEAWKDDPVKGVMAWMGGRFNNVLGSRQSVDAMINAYRNDTMGRIIHALDRSKLAKFAKDKGNALDIAKAFWNSSDQSVSKEARQIADLIAGVRSSMIKRINRAGAYIKELPEYVFRQAHDMDKIRKAGFEGWRDSIAPLLDSERTMKGVTDPEQFLRSVYDGLASGVHLSSLSDIEGDFARGGSLNDRVSAHRKLHFQDADSFLKYHSQFGNGPLMENLLEGINGLAKKTILLENFGTNPRAFFDGQLKDIMEKNRTNHTTMDRISGILENPENLFKTLSGELSNPQNVTLAKWTDNIKSIQSMAKLGGALISSISDLANTAAAMHYRGAPLLQSYADPLKILFHGNDANKREIAERLGWLSEGIAGNLHATLDIHEGFGSSTIRGRQNQFFKATGLNWWTDSLKSGVIYTLGADMGQLASKSFDEVISDAARARTFNQYGIDKTLWEAWRKSATEIDGKIFLAPDGIRSAPTQTLDGILKDRGVAATEFSRARLMDELETKFRTFYVDSADEMVLTPGARERAILNFGTQSGSLVGSAVRLMSQFKAFPVTYLTKSIGREASRGGMDAFRGMTNLIATTTILGYVSMATKDFIKGKEQRDPADPKAWTAAFIQGGGAGIYGDVLFAQAGFGRSQLVNLLGPSAGSADQLFSLRAKVMEGKDVTGDLLKLGTSHTPFLNLFYTKWAIDYGILYSLQEAANPGYLQRMESRMRREEGRGFKFSPNQYAGKLGNLIEDAATK